MGIDDLASGSKTIDSKDWYDIEISDTIDEVLLKVEQVIDLWWYDIIKKYFSLYDLNNFFDFYYLKLEDFKNIISKSEKLLNFYKEKTWESLSKISGKWILKFVRVLWIERPSYSEIKVSVKSKLQKLWVTYLNEFEALSINNFKKLFSQDNEFKYLFFRLFKKSISNIDWNDYKELWEKLDLEKLEKEDLNDIIRDRLKEKNIDFLEDLNGLWVKEFDDIIWRDLLIESYFLSIGIYKSFILKENIEDFWIKIGLKRKEINKSKYIINFLKYNRISNFSDLKDYPKTEIRSILWEDNVCRWILEGFWLTHLQDYRLDHLKRFARFVWLDWVPKDFELDEEKSKTLMLNILKQNKIDCTYSLEFNWIKWFKRLFKLQKIWNIYIDINTYIKNNIWKTIPNLVFEDLENIGVLLWLPTLDDIEHKKRFNKLLLEKNVLFKDLNKTKVKNREFWFNPNLRYFLDKVFWPTDVKLLRPNHIEDMKDYIISV